MRRSAQRVVNAFNDGGLGGAASTLRNGATWRIGRLRSKARRLRGPQLLRRSDRQSSPVRPEATLEVADERLRQLAEVHPERRPPVNGPKLTVAVVIPTYSDTRFLAETLASVQNQTFTAWRCYVVDDASPEDVNDVFDRFRDDERFVLLRHGANAGLSAARTPGCSRRPKMPFSSWTATTCSRRGPLRCVSRNCVATGTIRSWQAPTVESTSAPRRRRSRRSRPGRRSRSFR